MLFHTWPFLVFFLIVYSVYLSLRNTRFWIHWLLIASYFFYGWWNPLYLFLIAYSTLVDYSMVRVMDRHGRRKVWVGISVANNLLLLGSFKYAGFITSNINAVLQGLGIEYALPAPDFILPVGISFFTFQSLSYSIDFYRGHVNAEKSLVRYAAFVSLFPQLVAGPIERARDLLPQLRKRPAISGTDVADGLSLFVVGLFKKVALANYLSLYVDRVYPVPELYSGAALAVATFAFAWQIFFDFSGYTDMARGVARMLGIRLMLNFRNPYLATGLGDFWGRWHISLSTWFRDYVYIPLGGNRRGGGRMYRNLLLTFVISGFWHGAAWTFLIWGTLHGLGVVLTRKLERSAWYRRKVPRLLKQVSVFLFVCLAWVFFRAESLADAGTILSRIFGGAWGNPAFPLLAAVLVLSVWGYQFIYESRRRGLLEKSPVRVALVVLMIIYLATVPGTPDKPFIYFQF